MNISRLPTLYIGVLLGSILTSSVSFAQGGDALQRPYDCLLEPHLRLKLASPVAGVLKELHVDRGDQVRKGQKIAQLEAAVEEANVALAQARANNDAGIRGKQARMEFLQRKRDRLEQLRTTGSTSTSTFDEADTDFRFAVQDLRDAELNLEIAKLDYKRSAEVLAQRTVTSPIDGIIVERALGPGEYAFEQASILTVAQINPLNVEVYLPSALYPHVKMGMTATVRPEEPIGGNYKASVEIIDQVFDGRSGTFGVRLKLPNPDNRLPAGLRCKLEFKR
jgi:RND family efflux transporter MFP subunit